jgi:glycoprotein-N-acetylgalactosamine 3-beta-galactosyltransferase
MLLLACYVATLMSIFHSFEVSTIIDPMMTSTTTTTTTSVHRNKNSVSYFAFFSVNGYGDLNGSYVKDYDHSTLVLDKQPIETRPVPIPGPHPFQGAFSDASSNQSIVHDPYALRKRTRNIVPDDLQCDILPGNGPEGRQGYRFLRDRLKISQQFANHSSSLMLDHNDISSPTSRQRYRVLCAIYTYEGHANQTLAIADTWGARCDGFVAASTVTDLQLAKVRISHLGTQGAYGSIWQKVRSLLAYIYTNFIDEFDFVFLCGDDTYLAVENLKSWLSSPEVVEATRDHSEPSYCGLLTMPFWRRNLPRDFVYHGGGSGYTLNRAALKLFVEHGLNHSACYPNEVKSEEDLLMGLCMRHLGVSPILTQQDRTFLQYPTDPKGIINIDTLDKRVKQIWMSQLQWFAITHHIQVKTGLDAVSESSISFHGIQTASYMRRIDAIVYRSLESDCRELKKSEILL